MKKHLSTLLLCLGLTACQTPSLHTPAPRQEGNTLTLPTRPALSLQIGASFKPLAPLNFPIEKLTDVDRRVFVEADAAMVVKRLVIVQYETVQQGSTFKFRYPPKPPAQFGGETYRFGAYVYDDERAAGLAPDKEAGLTRAHLQKLGYRPPRLFRTARLARVADTDGMSEVIIFYLENADGEFPPGPLTGADEDGDLPLQGTEKDWALGKLGAAVHPV